MAQATAHQAADAQAQEERPVGWRRTTAVKLWASSPAFSWATEAALLGLLVSLADVTASTLARAVC
jgi:hypothetical protein